MPTLNPLTNQRAFLYLKVQKISEEDGATIEKKSLFTHGDY